MKEGKVVRRTGYAVLALIFVLLLSQSASAYGPLDWLSEQIANIWNYIFGLEERIEKLESSTTTVPVVCNPPYMVYGEECCLDENRDNRCDREETTTQQTQQTQATTMQSTTRQQTTLATTTTASSPTTTIRQQCSQGYFDNDPTCGQNCPARQTCVKSGITIQYAGQVISCYYCKDACPTDDPENKYYYDDPNCGGECNLTGGWYCFQSVIHQGCHLCQRPCPAGYYYKDDKCGDKCAAETECTKSAQLPDCYWCKSPCLEGYYYKDPECGEDCRINQYCKESYEDCYLCTEGCTQGYYYNDNTCNDTCDIEDGEVCGLLTGTQDCYYCKASTTTSVTTTSAPTTTIRATTTTIVQCGQGLYTSSNCDGRCDGTCETCLQYQTWPCYYCQKDCSRIGAGWGTSSVCSGCDLQHEDCVEHDSCDGCYHCVGLCPENLDYYRFQGCDADCDARLCRKVSESQPQSQYKDCYMCYPPVCGDGIISPPDEDCEDDFDCPEYHYCNLDCECTTDCAAYCADQGANGYARIAGIGSKAQCEAKMNADMNAKQASCRAVCGAYAWMEGLSADCCCVDTDWKPCLNCPNQNPALIDCQTPLAQCKAGL